MRMIYLWIILAIGFGCGWIQRDYLAWVDGRHAPVCPQATAIPVWQGVLCQTSDKFVYQAENCGRDLIVERICDPANVGCRR